MCMELGIWIWKANAAYQPQNGVLRAFMEFFRDSFSRIRVGEGGMGFVGLGGGGLNTNTLPAAAIPMNGVKANSPSGL